MNSQKKKKALSLNIVDVALIIIAFIAIAALIFFFSQRDVAPADNGESVVLEYTIVFTPLREEYRNLADIGDSLTDVGTLADIGEIVDVTYSDCQYQGVNKSTGEKVYTTYTGMMTMTLTVRAEAKKTSECYVINGVELVMGNEMNVRIPDFIGNGICKTITVTEA